MSRHLKKEKKHHGRLLLFLVIGCLVAFLAGYLLSVNNLLFW